MGDGSSVQRLTEVGWRRLQTEAVRMPGDLYPARSLRQAPPRVANGIPAAADITTDVWAPHVSGKEFKRNTKIGFQRKKNR
jgi:hypothetical protein